MKSSCTAFLSSLYLRRRILSSLLCGVLAVLAGFALLGTAGWFLAGAAFTLTPYAYNLFVPSSLVRAFSLTRIISRYFERIFGHESTLSMQGELRADVFQRLVRLPVYDMKQYQQADVQNRLLHDVGMIDQGYLSVIQPYANLLMGYIAVILAFAYGFERSLSLWWWLGPLVFIVLPLCLYRASYYYVQQVDLSLSELRRVIDHLLNIRETSRLFNHLDADIQRLTLWSSRHQRVTAHHHQWMAGTLFLAQLMATISLGWLLYQGTSSFDASPELFVGLVLLSLAFFECLPPVFRGSVRWAQVVNAAESIGSINRRSDQGKQADGSPIDGSLTIDIDSFHYPNGRSVPGLSGFSLAMKPGQRAWIRGSSGVGKTTLLELILKSLPLDRGAIYVGGQDIRAISDDLLYKHVFYVEHRPPVFLGTFRTNLTMVGGEATDVALWAVLDQVQLGDLVRSLPDGLDSWIGETGCRLSVGQTKRLALGRALLSSAQIWLLDEPSAAFDPELKDWFFEYLPTLAHGKTVLLVSHEENMQGRMALFDMCIDLS